MSKQLPGWYVDAVETNMGRIIVKQRAAGLSVDELVETFLDKQIAESDRDLDPETHLQTLAIALAVCVRRLARVDMPDMKELNSASSAAIGDAVLGAFRDQLVSDVCDVITTHQLEDYRSRCMSCNKELYGTGAGATLSRHRAEKVVDMLLAKGLVTPPSP